VEQRQEMIIGVVIPLILEHGRNLTSRQIAESCGIAEGTIFRAFGDKETLISTAVERYLDPRALHTQLRAIDPALSLDATLRAIMTLLRDRFNGVIRMMTALGRTDPPPRRSANMKEFEGIISDLLAPHRHELRIEPGRVAHFARVVAFATAIPAFGESIPFSTEDLVDLLQNGVVRGTTSSRKQR
jgi:AcrR family transcriptional regulator